MREIVPVAVVKGDGDRFGGDVLLAAQIGREVLEGERNISQALEKIHLRSEIFGRDAEGAEFSKVRFGADAVVAEDGHPGRVHAAAASS